MAKEEPINEENKKPKKMTFEEGIRECLMLLSDQPEALNFGVKKTDSGRHYYSFDDMSPAAKEVRDEVSLILNEIYQNGQFNYGQFASKLRVPGLSIQALLDDDFKEQHGL